MATAVDVAMGSVEERLDQARTRAFSSVSSNASKTTVLHYVRWHEEGHAAEKVCAEVELLVLRLAEVEAPA
jgi:hypothetical protein